LWQRDAEDMLAARKRQKPTPRPTLAAKPNGSVKLLFKRERNKRRGNKPDVTVVPIVVYSSFKLVVAAAAGATYYGRRPSQIYSNHFW
jgi:hypothetical protein